MTGARLEILLATFVLTCGQAFVWRRRDNVFAYLAAGTFLASYLLPIVATDGLGTADPALVTLYGRVLLVGAVAFLAGLASGAQYGNRSPNKVPLTFARSRPDGEVPRVLAGRSRALAVVAVVALLGSFAALGYIPLFAADRRSAKYGVGAYAAGFARGSVIYHFALALGGAVLPVMLVLGWRRRRQGVDVALAGMLLLGLLLTLSRETALAGPALFLVALAVHRGARPGTIVALVGLAFAAGALSNEVLFPAASTGPASVVDRVVASAPDVPDQLAFLQGYRLAGSQQIGTKTLLGGLGLGKGPWDPGAYTVRVLTGASDVSAFASGGLRLPAPMWGFVAYGFAGAVVWSFVAGLFTGWGTAKVRRLLDAAGDSPPSMLNMVLAWVFYTGTFGALAAFYFPQTADVVLAGVAIALGLFVQVRLASATAGAR